MDLRQISRQKLAHQRAARAFDRCSPWSGQVVVQHRSGLRRGRRVPDPDNEFALGSRNRRQRVRVHIVGPSIGRAANREWPRGCREFDLSPVLQPERLNTKSFSDRTNIKRSWVGEHRIVAAPSGDMAYEYGTVQMAYDSKSEGHREFKAVLLSVYKAKDGTCQQVAMTMQPLEEQTAH